MKGKYQARSTAVFYLPYSCVTNPRLMRSQAEICRLALTQRDTHTPAAMFRQPLSIICCDNRQIVLPPRAAVASSLSCIDLCAYCLCCRFACLNPNFCCCQSIVPSHPTRSKTRGVGRPGSLIEKAVPRAILGFCAKYAAFRRLRSPVCRYVICMYVCMCVSINACVYPRVLSGPRKTSPTVC